MPPPLNSTKFGQAHQSSLFQAFSWSARSASNHNWKERWRELVGAGGMGMTKRHFTSRNITKNRWLLYEGFEDGAKELAPGTFQIAGFVGFRSLTNWKKIIGCIRRRMRRELEYVFWIDCRAHPLNEMTRHKNNVLLSKSRSWSARVKFRVATVHKLFSEKYHQGQGKVREFYISWQFEEKPGKTWKASKAGRNT